MRLNLVLCSNRILILKMFIELIFSVLKFSLRIFSNSNRKSIHLIFLYSLSLSLSSNFLCSLIFPTFFFFLLSVSSFFFFSFWHFHLVSLWGLITIVPACESRCFVLSHFCVLLLVFIALMSLRGQWFIKMKNIFSSQIFNFSGS